MLEGTAHVGVRRTCDTAALARRKSSPVIGRSRSMSSFCGTYPIRVPGAQRIDPSAGHARRSAP